MSARRVDRGNRIRFTILGLLLLALGIAGLLVQAGVLSVEQPSDLWMRVTDAAARVQPAAVAAVLVVVGLLVLLYGLRLLRRQISTPGRRVGEITLQQYKAGSTTVEADAMSRALTQDLEHLPDVHDVTARLVSAGPQPRVTVRASIDGEARLATVRTAMEAAYERLCHVLGTESLQADLHVKPVPSQRSRVG